MAEGSNEIPAAQRLLQRAPIEGALITQERGADSLLVVKGNQPGCWWRIRYTGAL